MKTKKEENLHTPICVGNGLVALDVVISNAPNSSTQFFAGGSCGNVITILSYLGWNSFPIARLSRNVAAELLVEDLHKWKVKDDLVTTTQDGSTPIIIHRILKDNHGIPKHRFEFRNPEDGSYLPSYKPCLAKSVESIIEKVPHANVFYFDRINRASIDLAKAYKLNGAIVVFEPSNCKDVKGFNECLKVADIVKFSNDRINTYDELYDTGQVFLEIQTLGEKGLKYRRQGKKIWKTLPSYIIKNVVDSAGAGDWCTAGTLLKLFELNRNSLNKMSEQEIKSALRFGQILSALNCTYEGARGLMYNVKKGQLFEFVNQVLDDNILELPNVFKKSNVVFSESEKSLRISALFASI